jgi:hypothetical protein
MLKKLQVRMDSNPRPSDWNPMLFLFLIVHKLLKWQGWRDSNPRPSD